MPDRTTAIENPNGTAINLPHRGSTVEEENLRSIVERRTTVQDLITKARDNQGKVKPAIFTKVIADYDRIFALVEDSGKRS